MSKEQAAKLAAAEAAVSEAEMAAVDVFGDIFLLESRRENGLELPADKVRLRKLKRWHKSALADLSLHELALAEVQHGIDTKAPVLSRGAL